jgi:hypothetical protein
MDTEGALKRFIEFRIIGGKPCEAELREYESRENLEVGHSLRASYWGDESCRSSAIGFDQVERPQREWEFLIPGDYHADEAPTNPGNHWLALAVINGSWHLVPDQVKAERIDDAVVDRQGEKTGIRINAEHAGVIALLRIPNLTPRKVDAVDLKFKDDGGRLSLTAPLELSFRGEWYQLEAKRFGVYLRRGNLRTMLSDIFVGGPESDNAAWLLWAGDLDGDGALDLLVRYAGYNSGGVCLFLSASARPGVLVRHIACHGGIGC